MQVFFKHNNNNTTFHPTPYRKESKASLVTDFFMPFIPHNLKLANTIQLWLVVGSVKIMEWDIKHTIFLLWYAAWHKCFSTLFILWLTFLLDMRIWFNINNGTQERVRMLL